MDYYFQSLVKPPLAYIEMSDAQQLLCYGHRKQLAVRSNCNFRHNISNVCVCVTVHSVLLKNVTCILKVTPTIIKLYWQSFSTDTAHTEIDTMLCCKDATTTV